MKACMLLLVAVTLWATVDAQYGTTGISCPVFYMFGTYTAASASVSATGGTISGISSATMNCPICVQGTLGGTVTDTTTPTVYTAAGTATFCASSCPTASTVSISYTSGSTITVSGVTLHPVAYQLLVTTYDVPSTETDLALTITSMTCFGAGWKLSASPILLLAVVVAGFFMGKN